eukprot:Gregarina_sp_Pseudo_9__1908@NODE_230_length_3506_cov_6_791462_g214_i0_p2_GENE_NODE_230_length_3506_cov_6_791462_g214_i0NODE_230_length_3506_cov_6_791462_g214_i0_p2_ORF_typecomplete_len354_score54_57Lactamase_B_2/PF12706_7/4_3e30Lactamase_B/PF00753_27/2e10Lactamase_B_3/PF13483_6/6_2e08Lactamase_B_6/PF16661_5/0_00021Lactamase_B_4/PF13691_6/0_0024GST_C/PF00043_25/6_3GST_C/PF00043_25/1_2e02_NODE_230_length_3506_cov_6_791462_g214_i023703431
MEQLILLGTGPSCGLPQLSHVLALVGEDQVCSVCKAIWEAPSTADRRYNVSALIRTAHSSILIDMGKTCRQSFLAVASKLKISQVDAVLLTHDHADAIGGLDDLREFKSRRQSVIPVIAARATVEKVKQYFPWIVPREDEQLKTNVGRAAFETFETLIASGCVLAGDKITLRDVEIYLIPVHHGDEYICHGFVFGSSPGKRVLYISDVAWIPPESIRAIDALGPYSVFVIDSLAFDKPHYSHCCVEEILHFVDRWRPSRTFIVGFSCSLSRADISARLREKTALLRAGVAFSGPLETNKMNAEANERPERQRQLLQSLAPPAWRPPSTHVQSIELASDGLAIDLRAEECVIEG